jgi:hypothetical protein
MLHRKRMVLMIALAVGLVAGCNPFAPFLFTAYLTGVDREQRILFKFPADAKRIAVVTQMPFGTRVDMGHMDRDLNEKVARSLFEYFDTKKLTGQRDVVRATRVHKWQDEHPNWMNLDAGEIGRALRVDHLVVLEIRALSIYEQNSSRTLYKGHAEVHVQVYRISPESHEVVYSNPRLVVDFPTKDRSIPVAEISFQRFRDGFVDELAKRISWVFVPHETGDEFDRFPG